MTAATACGSDTSPDGPTTDAAVMCEESVEGESGPVRATYTCTIATDESGEEWTLQDLTFEG
ncbi:hypothetical protein ACIRPH_00640 [Nocardiopsis sp. NPDC101807]|uniref:hypothetical protein n=1 Tax=Nocardiopsis sp. NPDC101807 TaxID=3364339 RepID=UPI003800CD3E